MWHLFNNHPFHLVSVSPWPILGSMAVLNLTFSSADWMWGFSFLPVLIAIFSILLVKFQWWRDVTRESFFKGDHTKEVMKGLEIGMILFIISEIFFFLSFFWAFFHLSLSPDIHVGSKWPMQGIKTFNPMGIPFLNTVALLSSGVTITWAHQAMLMGNLKKAKESIKITILLGVYFTYMQMIEYLSAPFTIADSIYGSSFFMATGFHGLHVLIGTLFIVTSFIRMMKKHFSSIHFFGFEAAAWYWHFVDLVWLFLYIFVYWWGG